MVEVDNFGAATLVVAADEWVDAIRGRRDAGVRVFEMLTVVDQLDRGFDVVAVLRDDRDGSQVLVQTTVPREGAAVSSLVGVFVGADWYEREAYEMFGVTFEGHPGLTPLLLADGSPHYPWLQFPLRKDEWLRRRVQTPWPGVKEPGESGEVGQLDSPSEKSGPEKPGSEKRGSERPGLDSPSEKPASQKPASDKPASDKPASDKPASDKPASGRARRRARPLGIPPEDPR